MYYWSVCLSAVSALPQSFSSGLIIYRPSLPCEHLETTVCHIEWVCVPCCWIMILSSDRPELSSSCSLSRTFSQNLLRKICWLKYSETLASGLSGPMALCVKVYQSSNWYMNGLFSCTMLLVYIIVCHYRSCQRRSLAVRRWKHITWPFRNSWSRPHLTTSRLLFRRTVFKMKWNQFRYWCCC